MSHLKRLQLACIRLPGAKEVTAVASVRREKSGTCCNWDRSRIFWLGLFDGYRSRREEFIYVGDLAYGKEVAEIGIILQERISLTQRT